MCIFKRFNEEMIKVRELFKPIDLKVLTREVREHTFWIKVYALPVKSLLKVKQVMENYILVEEVDFL
jgi:hypothetical protein